MADKLKTARNVVVQSKGRTKHEYRHSQRLTFPQKKRGTMLAMYLVGSMMGSKKLRKKMGGKMTEGMTAPYRKALEN